jgi:hypothetical protein
MTTEYRVVCDHCEKRQVIAVAPFTTLQLPPDWYAVSNATEGRSYHFCTPRCLAKFYRGWLTTAVENVVPLSELMKSR